MGGTGSHDHLCFRVEETTGDYIGAYIGIGIKIVGLHSCEAQLFFVFCFVKRTMSFGVHPIISHSFSSVSNVMFLPFFIASSVLLSIPFWSS